MITINGEPASLIARRAFERGDIWIRGEQYREACKELPELLRKHLERNGFDKAKPGGIVNATKRNET